MLLWFRNDLRVNDNPALDYALKNGVKQALFFVTYKQWQEYHWSAIKIDLILRHVAQLKKDLALIGLELQVIELDSLTEQINYIITHYASQTLVVNRELELNENQRDAELQNNGVKLKQFNSDVIVGYGKLLNKSGEMYRVFTPFKRAWLSYVLKNGFDYVENPLKAVLLQQTSMGRDDSLDEIRERSESSKWPLAYQIEQAVLPNFLRDKIELYEDQRDIPSIKGTSGLSPYFAIGALSPRYVLRILMGKHPDILFQQPNAAFTWLNEIIWREFYRHLLFHFSNLIKGSNFNSKYDSLKWENNLDFVKAWQEGRTGYPIVDAAMRQLNKTGWMHNRLRMIVASFLTKHLLVDWRIGEQYFASKLIDYDFAANNGGWQWSAGTGCDAQPYFRIFNPITQSQKFDPQGSFIRKFLPELAEIPTKHIHFPHEYIQANGIDGYWPAIVEHKPAREKALNFYQQYL